MERGTSYHRHPWFGQPVKRQVSQNYGRLGGTFEVFLICRYGIWQLRDFVHIPAES